MPSIFLSASVPDPRLHPSFHEEGIHIPIREALRALINAMPADISLLLHCSPSILFLADRLLCGKAVVGGTHVAFMDACEAEDVHLRSLTLHRLGSQVSLPLMRDEMFQEHRPSAGVFLGGSEDVERAFVAFSAWTLSNQAGIFPVGSTGGAAKNVLAHSSELVRLSCTIEDVVARLENDIHYDGLFRDVFRTSYCSTQ